MRITKKFFGDLEKNPLQVFKELSDEDQRKVFDKLNQAYYNTNKPLVSDEIYDIINKHFTTNKDNVGAKPKGKKIELPVYMGSLDKIKDDPNAIEKFINKHTSKEFYISEKLDGISALYSPASKTLYTRGNGKIGENITGLLDYINGIVNINDDVYIRGELLLSRKNFTANMGANARNTVSGVVNSKTINKDVASLVDFIAYDYISKDEESMKNSLDILKTLGFNTPNFVKIYNKHLNSEYLSDILEKWKVESDYEIDGIVVKNNDTHKITHTKNPSYALAFKHLRTETTAEVVVTHIEWNISKDGLLKPIITFDPVNLGGVSIQKTTGFNAAYIKENNIGPGAVILIKRAGDVIPHIISIIKGVSKPDMPSISYVWKNKDIIVENHTSSVSALTNFFKSLDIKGIGPKMAETIYNSGYETPKDIVMMKKSEFLKIEGFGNKATLYDDIQTSIKNADCIMIMNAINVFGAGFGIKKLTSIIKSVGTYNLDKITYNELIEIQGVSDITADAFLKGYQKYKDFMKSTNLQCEFENAIIHKPIKQHVIVFSGIRDKDLEKQLEDMGHEVSSSLKKTTTILVVNDLSSKSSKTMKAKEMGIYVIEYGGNMIDKINNLH